MGNMALGIHSGKYGKYTIPLAVCESGKIYSNMIIRSYPMRVVTAPYLVGRITFCS